MASSSGVERPALTWLREYVETHVTGLDQAFFEELAIYPNPVTNGSIRLRGSESLTQVKILDLNGQQLKEVRLQNQPSVDIELNVAPGIYLVQLVSGKTFSFRRIVVK